MTTPNGAPAPAAPGPGAGTDGSAPVDPAAHLRAAAMARESYTESLAIIRSDETISELERAERAERAHRGLEHALDYFAGDLTAARRIRLTRLEGQLPVGPGIEAGTSEADRTVLLTAFRGHLEAARAADPETLAQRLEDAVAYGDSIGEKAIISHLLATPGIPGHHDLVARWADRVAHRGGTDHRPVLAERRQLLTSLSGNDLSTQAVTEQRAFGQRTRPTPPAELADLPRLRQQALERQRAAVRGVSEARPTPGDTRPPRVHQLPDGPRSRPVRALGE